MSDPLHIAFDTREQTPWIWPPSEASTTRMTLDTGDYALVDDVDDGIPAFAIERKSLDDYLGTISSGWKRFCREIDRMDGWPMKVIIVEGELAQVCYRSAELAIHAPEHAHYRLSPAFVMLRTAELTARGVSVMFAGDPSYAAHLALAILRQRARDIRCR